MVTAAELRGLREKYERMVALRELHDRARREPGFVEPDPRAELAGLAARFPGALREIDRRPLEILRDRIAELAAAERRPERAARWMIAQAVFHRLARGALVAKRWLGKRREVTDAMRTELASGQDEDARAWADDLASLARPPRGRLVEIVLARAGAELAMDAEEVRRLVFD